MNLKPYFFSTLLCVLPVTAAAQSIYPGQHTDATKVKDNHAAKAQAFNLNEVRLLPGRVRENLERDSAWMANISVKRLVHSFRNNAGVFSALEGGYEAVKKYGGWESLDCDLRGHTTGHLMSAYGLMYAATGADLFKQKGDSIVSALAEVQEALGNGYLSAFPEQLVNRNLKGQSVWAPWYTLHKILSGLIDQYLFTGNRLALDLARRMGDWAHTKLIGLPEETRRLMLRNEFGGVNEAFYNLYAVTGDTKYQDLARFFYHNDVIDPLAEDNFDFGTKHTNTFIPKLLGEARNYELNGSDLSRQLATGFWNAVTSGHSFATGSCSQKEHFFDTSKFSKFINGYTGESCCTYNMLKLSKHLFCWEPGAGIGDFYERALFNHILGQQDPESGMVCYFLPLMSGAYKVYSTPEQSFWCCVGSGFESHAKYAESIYFHGDNELFVNLFIPSHLKSEANGIELTQETGFPYSDKVKLTFAQAPVGRMKLSLRKPYWSGKPVVKINGKKMNAGTGANGFMTIERRWQSGDMVEVEYPMSLHLEATPDNPNRAALMYGPTVLAGDMGTGGITSNFSDPTVRNDYYTYNYHVPTDLNDTLAISKANAAKSITLTDPSRLEFTTSEGHTLRPIFDTHRTRYTVYWHLTPTK